MAFQHGKDSMVLLGAYDLSAYCRQTTVNFSKDVPDTTTYGDDSHEFALDGLRTGQVTISGLLDTADDGGDERLNAAFEATAATTPLTTSPQDSTPGNIAYLCLPWATDPAIDNPFDDAVAFSNTFQATGGVKRGHWLQALVAVTSIGDKTEVDAGEDWTAGGMASLHVTAFTGTNCTMIVKDSDDGISYSAVTGLGFTQFTGITSETKSIATTIQQWRLVNYAGTFTSITAAVALGR
jgi:hypothetical protein